MNVIATTTSALAASLRRFDAAATRIMQGTPAPTPELPPGGG